MCTLKIFFFKTSSNLDCCHTIHEQKIWVLSFTCLPPNYIPNSWQMDKENVISPILSIQWKVVEEIFYLSDNLPADNERGREAWGGGETQLLSFPIYRGPSEILSVLSILSYLINIQQRLTLLSHNCEWGRKSERSNG